MHPGQCPAPFTYHECWLNSLTLAISTNAGRSYSHSANPPSHLVATAPYQFNPGDGPYGYFEPSSIVKRADGYYYSLMRVEQSGVQPEGACLLRPTISASRPRGGPGREPVSASVPTTPTPSPRRIRPTTRASGSPISR